jgi:hypothetical protein
MYITIASILWNGRLGSGEVGGVGHTTLKRPPLAEGELSAAGVSADAVQGCGS